MHALLGDSGSWLYWGGEILLLAGFVLSFTANLAASCFGTFSRIKLDEQLAKLPPAGRDAINRRLAVHLEDIERKEYAASALAAISSILWGIGMVLPVYQVSLAWFSGGPTGDISMGAYLCCLAVATTILMVAAIGLPRVVALIAAEKLLIRHSGLFCFLLAPTLMLTRAADWIDRIVARLHGERASTAIASIHEEIGELVDEGRKGGHLRQDAGKMIEAIFKLHEKDVRAVMTPRTEIYCLPVEMPLETAIAKANDSGMSRLPVFENTRDSIVGVFYAKDALKYLDNNRFKTMKLREIMREPFFIPETRKLDGLLEELQRNKVHIAIVLDEFGGTAGLITVEDIVEEVVGEIVDEYEAPEMEQTMRVSDNELIALGKTPILRINELLGVSLPHDEDYDTIAGYVLAKLGRIPQVGEKSGFDNIQIEILAANPRKIEKLRIAKIEPAVASEAGSPRAEAVSISE